MTTTNILSLLGGLALFLYGMQMMGNGLEAAAGDRLKQILEKLTSNRFLGGFVCALVTAVIQSSSATTVMVVGFVNAGLMTLVQAVGVIMGANIGTTITAWIVSLGQLGDAVKVLKPSFYAPLLVGIGAILVLFSKKPKKKMAGDKISWLQRFIIWRDKNVKEKRFILLLSFLVGIFTALAALILKVLIHWIQNFLTDNFNATEANYLYLVYPVVGIFLAGLCTLCGEGRYQSRSHKNSLSHITQAGTH